MQYYMQFGNRARLHCNHLKNEQSWLFKSVFKYIKQSTDLFFFKEYKKHFLRLRIRGLVVRLQQESTFENSKRLIIDWANELVQSKIILNQDQIDMSENPLYLTLGILGIQGKTNLGSRQFLQQNLIKQAATIYSSVCDSTKAVKNGASAWDF